MQQLLMNTKQTKKNISSKGNATRNVIPPKRVFVGMSGGVDSSLAAALLKKEGYEVTGVFIKVWQPDFLTCTWRAERLDAMRVAAHLNIPLLTWDFEQEYKRGVADYMIQEYKSGRTPNPDVMCNKEIKFGAFFRRAMEEGADFVATGHYAQVVYDRRIGAYKMLAGVDKGKDQSYFLWTIGQEELSKTLFPVGKYKKSQVRKFAKDFNLPTAEKKDSQGICFIGDLDMKDFLAHYMTEKIGEVIDEQGKKIGTHRGAYFYTLGERHGFTITKKGSTDSAYYVIAKDILANTITVAQAKSTEQLLCTRTLVTLKDANFCSGKFPVKEKKYMAQVRYHGEQLECKILELLDKSFSVEFSKPVLVASGQSVVLYDGSECIGGGIVE